MATQDVYVEWIAKLFPPQGKWSESDFFALPDSNQIIELSDGEIIMSPAPTFSHQNAVGILFGSLHRFVLENQLGIVIVAPFGVRLWEDKIREPDVLFVQEKNRNRIQKDHFDGAPDWVAEVISPGSRKTDEVDKLAEYAEAGIPEYWIVDLEKRTIRVFHLEGTSYQLVTTYSSGQVAEAVTIDGFTVPVDEVIPT
jgi:Uma2 family endonuclease